MSEKVEEATPKSKSKKRIILIILLLVVMLLSTFGIYYAYQNVYKPMNTNYSADVKAQNEAVIAGIDFSKYDYVEVQNINEEPVEKIDLSEETKELTLPDPEDVENSIFVDWSLSERTENREIKILDLVGFNTEVTVYEATPIYEEAGDYVLTFRTDENAHLLEDEQIISYTRAPYQSNQPINEVFPNIELNEGYNGDWTVNDKVIDKNTEITEDSEVVFKSYQDLNENNTDDFTETFTINFETNAEQSIDPIENVGWEETIDLPVVEDNNLIFYDWYTDSELKNIFTEETKVQNDLTLYADVKSLNEVMNESVMKPITRKDVAVQVEELLSNRNAEVDKSYQQLLDQEEKQREEVRQYNLENNIMEPQKPVTYQLNDTDKDKLHLINFLDPSNNFLFAFVAPYGQSIKITDEAGRLVKEYAVRQQTHIVLDEQEIISSDMELDEYHTEYKQVNETVFIKIQPIIK